jgi:L-threonylcarbamoyladenylate synthase
MACPIADPRIVWRQAPSTPAAFAQELYAALRELDAHACVRLVVQKPPDSDVWRAVVDRLRRAAAASA